MAITGELAAYIAASDLTRIPTAVRHEGVRAFVNWLGCVLGGCREPSVEKTAAVFDRLSGPREATVIGRRVKMDMLHASYLNSLSNAVHGYNDTHLKTVGHPTGPVAAALCALAESRRPASGAEFLHALILGIEIQGRIGNVLITPPARLNPAFSMLGLVGGAGVATAAAKLLGLSAQQTDWAIGQTLSNAGALRETFGGMAAHVPFAQPAIVGLTATFLAAEDFTCTPTMLEGKMGFARAYGGETANAAVALDRLGAHFETLDTAYKPYPCGIVVHPVIDACLDLLRAQRFKPTEIERIDVKVSPTAQRLCDRKEPANHREAKTSLQHWAALCMLRGAAGLAEGEPECFADPAVTALRRRVEALADPAIGDDSAHVTVTLRGGKTHAITVEHCRGSVDRPMSDGDLDEKFLGQAGLAMEPAAAQALLAECWRLEDLPDIGGLIRRYFPVP